MAYQFDDPANCFDRNGKDVQLGDGCYKESHDFSFLFGFIRTSWLVDAASDVPKVRSIDLRYLWENKKVG